MALERSILLQMSHGDKETLDAQDMFSIFRKSPYPPCNSATLYKCENSEADIVEAYNMSILIVWLIDPGNRRLDNRADLGIG